ncbi:potassium transporter TrkA [Streptomyces sp. YC504]|uniref:Potassium transporter TrkA n=1 Tax=Streptomyces mesophilus TaxID=1775132 RepID=A0A6G4XQJ8_9ACTN|nr:NAD(P)-binding protein [Streptomyces mesophilus]NGO79708.1 potassium transporter TrkA [Streptomyces mesophilus]
MVVCGDDALAQRLAGELREVYRGKVTLVVPPAGSRSPLPLSGRERAGVLLGRVSAALGRGPAGTAPLPDEEQRLVETAELTDEVLAEAGVAQAAALALVYDDDETNIRAALAARRFNPRLRLVIRLYNRKLGQHLAELLDQASLLADPGLDTREISTTVLSDADTAAPALAAAAVAGTRKVLQADGLLLQAVERQPGSDGSAPEGLCTLALLSAPRNDPQGADVGPQLLPDDAAVTSAEGRGAVVLQAVQHNGPPLAPGRLAGRSAPLRELFSRRLRWSLAGLLTAVLALAVASWLTGDDHPLHATYLTLLDLFALNDPATDEPHSRQILQLLAALAGLLLLPVLLAAALEAFGTFRTAAALRRPPRGLSGHLVLLGLGKIGTRVLTRLRELGIPVVCVEEDPEARGIPHARRLRVPVIIGDVTEEGVLEAAKIHRAHALLALTSVDTTNLEAALYARSVKPDLGVVLRLYDDEFATAVFRTLRAAHPGANTRSRSVTTLAAPAFAAAMMGRRILGAIPVERKVLLFAALDVADHPELQDRTVAEAFRAGAWRVVALDTSAPAQRLPDLSIGPPPYSQGHTPGLVWDLHPGHVLSSADRVVVAATRRGLAQLLGQRRESGRVAGPRTPDAAAPGQE